LRKKTRKGKSREIWHESKDLSEEDNKLKIEKELHRKRCEKNIPIRGKTKVDDRDCSTTVNLWKC
jgi:hypothetical protein